MGDDIIRCPRCGAEIPLTEALTSQIETSVRARLEAARQKIAQEEKSKVLAEQGVRTKALEQELAEKRQQIAESNQKELELRLQQRKLEDEKLALDLTVQRKLDEEKQKIVAAAQQRAVAEQELKLREKDNLLAQLQAQIESLKRRAEVGSQEAQGEALEASLKERLAQTFPLDLFDDVKKGARGADILQTVRNQAGSPCGLILWETKSTQAFCKDWLPKHKKDQQEAKAELAVLVSLVLPKEVTRFGLLDDIWIADYQTAAFLAAALRQTIISVARAKAVVANKDTLKGVIYDYVTSQEFVSHVQTIFTAFEALKKELETEKRSLARLWKIREKQIESVFQDVTSIYSSLESFAGSNTLPKIQSLMLEAAANELQEKMPSDD